jgi:phosphate transport system substrate-binding protein
MKRNSLWRLGGLVAATASLAAVAATAGSAGPAVSGSISMDGSSTVAPFAQAAAERFQRANRGSRVTVGVSGTGGGFERFCKGEIDMANASRPIRYSEAAKCHSAGIRYIQFLVANDGISIVTSRNNSWASCLTTDELKKIWNQGSKVSNWNEVRTGFPSVPLKLYGPGTDSGTFEFFTEKINGRARQSRSDYTPSENDNVLVEGVAGDRGAMGYFGLSYYLENQSRLKLIGVDAGSGCTTPNVRRVQARAYKPLSRGLFIYVKRTSFQRAVVKAFVRFMIANEVAISRAADMVPLTKQQLAKAKRQYNVAIKNPR